MQINVSSTSEAQPATLTEIYNQARSSQETVERHPARSKVFERFLPLEAHTDIILTGCGSSYNLSRCAAFAWSALIGRPVSAVPSSELMNFPERYLNADAHPLVIAISRTGGTTEVELAVERLRAGYGAATLAITGHSDTSIAKICDDEVAFDECPEESVVMTQAFTCMLLGLYLLADEVTGKRFKTGLEAIPVLIGNALSRSEGVARALVERVDDGGNAQRAEDASGSARITHFFFLGSGAMKGLADEGALKMTEMALTAANSYGLLEFRHGPKAALDPEALVVAFPSSPEGPYLDTLLGEVEATGSRMLLVGDPRQLETPVPREGLQSIDLDTELPDCFRPALYAHVTHLMAYFRARSLEINPDFP
ncbi:MAG TPA: SIS domain-containing protein, partial [Blastocatellia bacterium]|nr:SIS domain-containing protein [Blastocatellia bacterium]